MANWLLFHKSIIRLVHHMFAWSLVLVIGGIVGPEITSANLSGSHQAKGVALTTNVIATKAI